MATTATTTTPAATVATAEPAVTVATTTAPATGCAKLTGKGFYRGVIIASLKSSKAPDGKAWTWQQCAVSRALERHYTSGASVELARRGRGSRARHVQAHGRANQVRDFFSLLNFVSPSFLYTPTGMHRGHACGRGDGIEQASNWRPLISHWTRELLALGRPRAWTTAGEPPARKPVQK